MEQAICGPRLGGGILSDTDDAERTGMERIGKLWEIRPCFPCRSFPAFSTVFTRHRLQRTVVLRETSDFAPASVLDIADF